MSLHPCSPPPTNTHPCKPLSILPLHTSCHCAAFPPQLQTRRARTMVASIMEGEEEGSRAPPSSRLRATPRHTPSTATLHTPPTVPAAAVDTSPTINSTRVDPCPPAQVEPWGTSLPPTSPLHPPPPPLVLTPPTPAAAMLHRPMPTLSRSSSNSDRRSRHPPPLLHSSSM